jgi:hypothetical protein
MALDRILEILKVRTGRKFYKRIADDHLDTGSESKPITANAAYFELRLPEMFLCNTSEFGRSFVPLVMMASEFNYDGHSQSLPFLSCNDILRDIDKYVKDKSITRGAVPC